MKFMEIRFYKIYHSINFYNVSYSILFKIKSIEFSENSSLNYLYNYECKLRSTCWAFQLSLNI